jgi:hypothetical protein
MTTNTTTARDRLGKLNIHLPGPKRGHRTFSRPHHRIQLTGPGILVFPGLKSLLPAPGTDPERSAQIPTGRRGTPRTSLGTIQAGAPATRGGLDSTAPHPLSLQEGQR